MNQNEPADWIFDYDLSKKIQYLKAVTDSPTIAFKKEENYITGFQLKIRDKTTKEAEDKAKIRATDLKNILTILSGMPVEATLQSMKTISKPNEPTTVYGTFGFHWGIDGGVGQLDLNDPVIQSIINTSEYKRLRYEHVSKGIFYLYNGQPTECIKEVFQVIESDKSFPNYYKNKVIRDMFSHSPPYEKDTVTLFEKEFVANNFEFKKYDNLNGWIIFDSNSNKNSRIFYEMVEKLVDNIKREIKLDY